MSEQVNSATGQSGKMTATELAKMLVDWPNDAQPRWLNLDKGEKEDSDETLDDIDLACMSGERHLATTRGGFMREDYHCGVMIHAPQKDDRKTWACLGSGPTLLHAIDAAIKATKGNQ